MPFSCLGDVIDLCKMCELVWCCAEYDIYVAAELLDRSFKW